MFCPPLQPDGQNCGSTLADASAVYRAYQKELPKATPQTAKCGFDWRFGGLNNNSEVLILSTQENCPDLCDMLLKIRKAKDASGLTNQELADIANIPYNSVCTITGCTAKQVTLANAAALCAALGISLDELAGLRDTDEAGYIHDLEIDNARQTERTEHIEHICTIYRRLIICIASLTALLACTVIGYIVFDIRMEHAGLFRSAGMPIAAVFLALIVVAALIAIAYTIKTVAKEK